MFKNPCPHRRPPRHRGGRRKISAQLLIRDRRSWIIDAIIRSVDYTSIDIVGVFSRLVFACATRCEDRTQCADPGKIDIRNRLLRINIPVSPTGLLLAFRCRNLGNISLDSKFRFKVSGTVHFISDIKLNFVTWSAVVNWIRWSWCVKQKNNKVTDPLAAYW